MLMFPPHFDACYSFTRRKGEKKKKQSPCHAPVGGKGGRGYITCLLMMEERGKKKYSDFARDGCYWGKKNQGLPQNRVSPPCECCSSLAFYSRSHHLTYPEATERNKRGRKKNFSAKKGMKRFSRFSLQKDLDLDDENFILYH